MEMKSPPPCPPTVTVRRNPPRKARNTPSSAVPLRELFSSPAPPTDVPSCPLRDILSDESIEIPEKSDNHEDRRSPKIMSENLKVYLRIRPVDIQRHGVQHKSTTESKNAWPKNPKVKINSRPKLKKSTEICVQINDDLRSVTVSTPQALQETKRIKSEAYEGFSHVFSSEASQTDVYEKMVNPLVEDFLNGKSGLLVAMGPTGSGKTHTVFGCAREPGMVPLALRRIFSKSESGGIPSSRIFHLSMFEICSEKGKAERMIDLLHDGGEMCMQQSVVRGLQEVVVFDTQQAELLIAQGMLKRSTAMTNSNSQSSRSQCIINIRCDPKKTIEDIDGKSRTAVLSIVDLAGAEKEKKTGNQGTRLLESNFINNNSMVFGQCLRSLLEHQKNQTKPLQKHYQYSLLTRYLREYLEGKKRMMLILTVKPGIEDYLSTSFLLRQASPLTKIKFKSLVEPVNVTCSKRPNQAFPRAEQLKKMKINSDEAYLVAERIGERNVPLTTTGIAMKVKKIEIDDASLTEIEILDDGFASKEVSGKSSSEKDCVTYKNDKDRKYQILQGFSKALWNVLKHYKEKLEGVENENCDLRDSLTKEQTRNLDLQNELTHEKMKLSHLENELKQSKSHYMCHKQACTDLEFSVSLNYACSSPSKCESASSSEVRDPSVTFASSDEVEEHRRQQLEVLSKSIDDAEDAVDLKDTGMSDMYSRTESPPVSSDNAEDDFKAIDTLDMNSTSETHCTSHAQDAAGFKDTSTVDLYSEPKDFKVSAVDVEDGMINTGTSDLCCTSETTSLLESVCLRSSHEYEQAAETFVADANNLTLESDCALNGSCVDASLECESKNTPQDYENLRYANRDQTQLENRETEFSKAEPPKNDEICFLAEEAQFNTEESKLNPSITILPKEGSDGSKTSETVSKFASCGNFQLSDKPKRRLLPASSVLLKDISRLEVNDDEDKPKGARGAKRTLVDDKNRTQGSLSLLHLLTAKLDR
ncbi:kinesin-like protein KIN-6 [Henckelia pumila]|uniref:kinesin-like protein KIN-6 n=1 Tax=Henckelia pumila TaxID=405737 RepID=UPI003C6DE69D